MRCWPALNSEDRDGWLVRAAGGSTRHSNSVWAQGSREKQHVSAKLEAVEKFYGQRGLPPTFYVSPGIRPQGLDAVLEQRGYYKEGLTIVHTGLVEDIASGAASSPDVSVELVEELDDGWLDAHFRCARRSGSDARNRASIMRRIEPSAAFASAIIGNEVVAVAMGVLEHGWLGFYNVVTDPQFRRHGASRALLTLLGEWALGQGAKHAHLGVEEDNLAAIALYQQLSMTPTYRYHYRSLSAHRPPVSR